MSKNKWMDKLLKSENAIKDRYNVHAEVLETHSPSLNFTFGKGWGLPRGASLLLYGPPKAGKTVICNSFVGKLHQADPEAIAIKFDTEFRDHFQMNDLEEAAKNFGIDIDRYKIEQTNEPDKVFDYIEKDVAALCEEGAPIKLIIIDSLSGIQGIRNLNADSVLVQQIGDEAMTYQKGLKRILPVIRKYKISLIITAQLRAQMDVAAQMRGEKTKAAVAFGVQHFCEYFMMVEPNLSKEGRTNLEGNKLEDEEMTDFMDNSERTGHKVRVKMVNSSLGPKNRVGEFTLDYDFGIINTHEEALILGVGRKSIEKPTSMSYTFEGNKWTGQKALLAALKQDPDLCQRVLADVRKRELTNHRKRPDSIEVNETLVEEQSA